MMTPTYHVLEDPDIAHRYYTGTDKGPSEFRSAWEGHGHPTLRRAWRDHCGGWPRWLFFRAPDGCHALWAFGKQKASPGEKVDIQVLSVVARKREKNESIGP